MTGVANAAPYSAKKGGVQRAVLDELRLKQLLFDEVLLFAPNVISWMGKP